MGSTNAVPESEVARTIAAGFPVIYVLTWEEERLEQMLHQHPIHFSGLTARFGSGRLPGGSVMAPVVISI